MNRSGCRLRGWTFFGKGLLPPDFHDISRRSKSKRAETKDARNRLDRPDRHNLASMMRSLKSAPGREGTMTRICLPSAFHRRAATLAASMPTTSASAAKVTRPALGAGGRIRRRMPPALMAAQVGMPVTSWTERAVSIPSATAISLEGLPR